MGICGVAVMPCCVSALLLLLLVARCVSKFVFYCEVFYASRLELSSFRLVLSRAAVEFLCGLGNAIAPGANATTHLTVTCFFELSRAKQTVDQAPFKKAFLKIG